MHSLNSTLCNVMGRPPTCTFVPLSVPPKNFVWVLSLALSAISPVVRLTACFKHMMQTVQICCTKKQKEMEVPQVRSMDERQPS